MGDMMTKEQAEHIEEIKAYCLAVTDMTESEAYKFALICWQLGFIKFDMNNVLDELEKLKKQSFLAEHYAYKNAIDIVKAGGMKW